MREKLIELVNNVLKCLPWGEVSSHTAEDVADHLIANGVILDNQVSSSKWIPVSERLPEDGSVVLGVTKYDDFYVFQWCEPLHRWCDVYKDFRQEYVTHWMPLPEPQEGE